MKADEWAMVLNHAKQVTSIFEWGCGGSTVEFAKIGLSVTSVDTDAEWLAKVTVDLQKAGVSTPTTLIHGNLGPVKGWGYPVRSCSGAPYVLHFQDTSVPLVLIDGRYRVACALRVAHVAPNATVIIHDFQERSWYHVLLQTFDMVQTVQSLVVLRKKADVIVDENAFLKYVHDAR